MFLVLEEDFDETEEDDVVLPCSGHRGGGHGVEVVAGVMVLLQQLFGRFGRGRWRRRLKLVEEEENG